MAGGMLLLGAAGSARAQAPDFAAMSAEERAAFFARIRAESAADRKRTMDRLGLKEPADLPAEADDPNRPQSLTQRPNSPIWLDASRNVYVRASWGAWPNYLEEKAGTIASPDALILKNGRAVKDAQTWWRRRRPEILADYQREVYGRIPRNTPAVRFELAGIDTAHYPGQAVVKLITGHIDNSSYPAASPSIRIKLYLPPKTGTPPPLLVVTSAFLPRDSTTPPPPVAQMLAEGWAVAFVGTYHIQADWGSGLTEGVIGLVNHGRQRAPDDWGVIAAWSWGLSRALDYFTTDPSVDAKRAAIFGHSRWGKTALVAAALDQRWAMAFASCSGAMGASLEKRNYGETIDHVAGSEEYHWMAANFLKYGGNWHALPVDAHLLIALIAPRPVFIAGGTTDSWADPHGQFLAALGADPVYRLLGAQGLGSMAMPEPDIALTSGAIAFRNHIGGHTFLPDFPAFIQWSRRYFFP